MVSPVALELFGFKIYWYGITYAIGFLFAYFFIIYYSKNLNIKKEKIENIILYTMLFSLIGGRVFEIIFYNLSYYLTNPLKIIAVWEGGMSIHGGFTGGFLALLYFSKRYKIQLLKLTDLFVIPLALVMVFGRLTNFINQELVGKITNSSFGIKFPLYDNEKRLPTQLIESFKNLLIFQTLYYLYLFKKLKDGMLSGIFLILYNFIRFFIEFFKEPTFYIYLISMSQLLCLIYLIFGVVLIYHIKTKH